MMSTESTNKPLEAGSTVEMRDGRIGRVESISRNGIAWIRDQKGYLSSADPKSGWSGDGNWRNDINPTNKTR